MATVYGLRIVSSKTGDQLGASEKGLASAFALGQMAADAYTVLIGRDGHHPDDLEIHAIAVDDGNVRSLTKTEESAMVSALDQYKAKIENRYPE